MTVDAEHVRPEGGRVELLGLFKPPWMVHVWLPDAISFHLECFDKGCGDCNTFEATADRNSFRHLSQFPTNILQFHKHTYLSKWGAHQSIPIKLGFEWFWYVLILKQWTWYASTPHGSLNQTGTCRNMSEHVGTMGLVGLRTYGFFQTSLQHGWVKWMIHDLVQFPYILRLPQDRVLCRLKDFRRRYLSPKIWNPQDFRSNNWLDPKKGVWSWVPDTQIWGSSP